MSILARDKVPPKTVKANINIPHCRGIPTKLPNQSHSRVVSKRLYKQKGKERRREGREKRKEKERKTGGRTEKKKKGGGGNVRRLSNDRQLLPPFRAKVQRSEVKARRKNCHEWANRPRASSAHVYFTVYCAHALETNPRVYLHEGWRESGNLWMILCIASCRGSHRVIVTSWKPDTGRDPFCSSHSSVSRIGRCVLFDYAFILRILFEWRAKFYVYLYIATQWLKSSICNNVTRK